MNADDITTWASVAAAAASGASAIIGGLWSIARFVLLLCDALDERWPRLKKITNPLGKFLGGSKGRY